MKKQTNANQELFDRIIKSEISILLNNCLIEKKINGWAGHRAFMRGNFLTKVTIGFPKDSENLSEEDIEKYKVPPTKKEIETALIAKIYNPKEDYIKEILAKYINHLLQDNFEMAKEAAKVLHTNLKEFRAIFIKSNLCELPWANIIFQRFQDQECNFEEIAILEKYLNKLNK